MYLILTLWVGWLSLAQAATPMRFNRLGIDAGLSEQAVHVVVQDSSGYLWIGTEDGLDRYDGYRFVHFRQSSTGAQRLPNDFISDLRIDHAGVLWIGTEGGVVRRDSSTGTLDRPGPWSRDPELERVNVIYPDRQGRLWVGTRDAGLALYDPVSNSVHRFRAGGGATALTDDSILQIAEDHVGNIWVGTKAGVDVIGSGTGQLTHHDFPSAGTRRLRSNALLEDDTGAMWIGTDAGLEVVDAKSPRVAWYPTGGSSGLPTATIETLYEDREHRLWVGTSDGLARFDRQRNRFDVYRNDPRDPASLPDNHVVSLLEDRGGVLWVGTQFGGLAKWNPRSWSLGHHLAVPAEGFPSNNIMSFAEDRAGGLWIGTFGGLVAVDSEGRATRPPLLASSGALGDERVMAVLSDSKGILWIGTMAAGLVRMDVTAGSIAHYRHNASDPTSLAADGVMSLFEDSRGRLWVGTFGGGLSRLDGGAQAFRNYTPSRGGAVASGRVTALAEDHHGLLWVGMDGGGVTVMDPDRGPLLTLRHDPDDVHSLGSDTVYAIYVDKQDNVWIGTRGGGLARAELTSAAAGHVQLTSFSESTGLPNNTIYGIVPDSTGRLWLSTNHGIASLDPRSGTVRSYHRDQGLQADEFNFGAYLRTRDGRVLFGGSNGYNEFRPERLDYNRTPPPVVLTSVTRMGQPLRAGSPPDNSRSFHFDYRDSLIAFEFAALDYAAPESNQFRYRLEGFDREWNAAGTRRMASYTGLPGGAYTLHVLASNSDGAWSADGLSLRIDVDPPPWKTWWAYSLYSLAGSLLPLTCWHAQRRAMKRAARHRDVLEHKVTERTRQLADRNTALQRANSLLEEASLTDVLTGLGNRRSLAHSMPRLIESVTNTAPDSGARCRLALLLVDLDRLKPINDQHGHQAGDRLLAEVASILKECVRAVDHVVRWGGDEFVIVHAVRNLDEASALAERIRLTVAKRRFRVCGTDQTLSRTSCSIGFALYPFVREAPARLSWERVLSISDANLYRAKSTRNTWIGCDATARAASGAPDLERLLEKELELAERQGFITTQRSDVGADETVELLLRRGNGPERH